MIDRQLFDGYSRALGTDAMLAAQAVDEFVIQFSDLMGGQLDVEELTAALLDYYPNVVRAYGDAAATAALEFYEESRASAFVEGDYTPELADEVAAQLLADDVYVATRPKANGTTPQNVSASLQGMAQRRVMQQADGTIRRNVMADPAHPRWAFVPHAGACGFCIMLGSRGFVYWNEGTVLASRHHNCLCTPVADFDTENPHLDGYDPDAMYSAYLDARRTVDDQAWRDWQAMSDEERRAYGEKWAHGGYGWDHFQQRAIVEEMNRRSRDWLQDQGALPEVDYMKPREDLLPHERTGVDLLQSHGFRVGTILEDGGAPANLDLLIGTFGSVAEWELKNVTNASTSVENQMKRARIKWYKLGREDRTRAVFTLDGCTDSFDDVAASVYSRLKDGEEALVLGMDGEIRRIHK